MFIKNEIRELMEVSIKALKKEKELSMWPSYVPSPSAPSTSETGPAVGAKTADAKFIRIENAFGIEPMRGIHP